MKWRTGFSSYEEMDDHTIAVHNSYVGKTDIVYHIGDLQWKGDPKDYLSRLNGYWYIIRGNHDRHLNFVMKGKVMHVVDGYYNITVDKQPITLCHFPMISWNRSHFNAWHLHGHHHSALPAELIRGKMLNVNYDVLHRPIEFSEVRDIMMTKPDNWDYKERI